MENSCKNNFVDYYPFGMLMPGRALSTEDYRFGFNGHEKDDEVKGSGNHLSFGDYGYDTRLGRRWQLDPEPIIGVSGYSAFNDNPILYADPDGKFPIIPIIAAAVAYYSSAKIMERSEGNANLRTAGYSMLHPINASQVYFKSNVAATNFQVNIGRAAGLNNREGGGQNAIRHTLWQSLNTRDVGAKQSSRAGYAHETTANVDLNKRAFGGADALERADQTIDLLNNQIGRAIGEQNEGADNITMAKAVVNEYYKNGLWTSKEIKNKDGNVVGQSIQKTKLTKDQYNAAMTEIDSKGQDGLNKKSDEKK